MSETYITIDVLCICNECATQFSPTMKYPKRKPGGDWYTICDDCYEKRISGMTTRERAEQIVEDAVIKPCSNPMALAIRILNDLSAAGLSLIDSTQVAVDGKFQIVSVEEENGRTKWSVLWSGMTSQFATEMFDTRQESVDAFAALNATRESSAEVET